MALPLTVDQALTRHIKLKLGGDAQTETVEGNQIAAIQCYLRAQVSNVVEEKTDSRICR